MVKYPTWQSISIKLLSKTEIEERRRRGEEGIEKGAHP